MLTYYPADARGRTAHHKAYCDHHFTFGDFYNPTYFNFSALRGIHTYVIETGGAYQFQLSKPYHVLTILQSGRGSYQDTPLKKDMLYHHAFDDKEYTHIVNNLSEAEPCHIIQYLIDPETIPACHNHIWPLQKKSPVMQCPLPETKEYIDMSMITLLPNEVFKITALERSIWVHVIDGNGKLGDIALSAGDSVHHIHNDTPHHVTATEKMTVMLFDMHIKQ